MRTIKLIGFFTFLFLATISLGQNNCDSLKAENEKLNSKLTNQGLVISKQKKNIEKLNSEIEYYKETLNLLNSKISAEGNNVIFRINSITGKSDLGKILIEGLIENKGAVGKFQTQNIELTDPKGNHYKTYKVSFGEERYIPSFQKNIPTKIMIEFDKIIEETPMIKALVLNIYGEYPGRTYNVIFKNLPVVWE